MDLGLKKRNHMRGPNSQIERKRTQCTLEFVFGNENKADGPFLEA